MVHHSRFILLSFYKQHYQGMTYELFHYDIDRLAYIKHLEKKSISEALDTIFN